jgi:hypothetical protein
MSAQFLLAALSTDRLHSLDEKIDEQPRPHRELPAEGVNDMHRNLGHRQIG